MGVHETDTYVSICRLCAEEASRRARSTDARSRLSLGHRTRLSAECGVEFSMSRLSVRHMRTLDVSDAGETTVGVRTASDTWRLEE
jgi:hypothetical protein